MTALSQDVAADLRRRVAELEQKLQSSSAERDEAIAQQAATAEVLQVISSSVADTTPVFDKILESCERLFNGSQMIVFLLGNDEILEIGAIRGSDPDRIERTRRLLPRAPIDNACRRVERSRRVRDAAADRGANGREPIGGNCPDVAGGPRDRVDCCQPI
jgi:hypothetical protein